MKNLELNSNKIKNKTHITKFLLKNKQKEGELKKYSKYLCLFKFVFFFLTFLDLGCDAKEK